MTGAFQASTFQHQKGQMATLPAVCLPPWSELKATPLRVYDLHHCLVVIFDQVGIFNQFQDRFLSSDLTWFAAGASEDNCHLLQSPWNFFPDFLTLWGVTPIVRPGNWARKAFGEKIQCLLWDLATIWDWTFGSTTMILHIEGTTTPGQGAPSMPVYLQAADSVAEEGSQSQMGAHPEQCGHPKHGIPHLIPQPKSVGSTNYIFVGQLYGKFNEMFPDMKCKVMSGGSSHYGSDESMDENTLAMVSAIKRISFLELKVKSLESELQHKKDSVMRHLDDLLTAGETIDTLNGQLEEWQQCYEQESTLAEQVKELQGTITSLQVELAEMCQGAGPVDSMPLHPLVLRWLPTLYVYSITNQAYSGPLHAWHHCGHNAAHPRCQVIRGVGGVGYHCGVNVGAAEHYDCIIEWSGLAWTVERQPSNVCTSNSLNTLCLSAMPKAYTSTIASRSNPCIHQPPKLRAPAAPEELKKKHIDRHAKRAEIDDCVNEWFSYTWEMAETLPSGAKMVNSHDKINPYNAFKREKAAECRENREHKHVAQLHTDYIDKYHALTDEEKDALVEWFKDRKTSSGTCPIEIKNLYSTDMCSFASSAITLTSTCHPQWFFTSKELEAYMPLATCKKWDTREVGTKIEAFAVAGCNMLSALKQKADYLKVEETNNPIALMNYVNFEEKIVHKYGVVMIGWTGKFTNPGELSSYLPALQDLFDDLQSRKCRFETLSKEAHIEYLEKYQADITAGLIVPPQHKGCNDARKPWGPPAKAAWVQNADNNNNNDSPDKGASVEGDGERDEDGEDNAAVWNETAASTAGNTTTHAAADATMPNSASTHTTVKSTAGNTTAHATASSAAMQAAADSTAVQATANSTTMQAAAKKCRHMHDDPDTEAPQQKSHKAQPKPTAKTFSQRCRCKDTVSGSQTQMLKRAGGSHPCCLNAVPKTDNCKNMPTLLLIPSEHPSKQVACITAFCGFVGPGSAGPPSAECCSDAEISENIWPYLAGPFAFVIQRKSAALCPLSYRQLISACKPLFYVRNTTGWARWEYSTRTAASACGAVRRRHCQGVAIQYTSSSTSLCYTDMWWSSAVQQIVTQANLLASLEAVVVTTLRKDSLAISSICSSSGLRITIDQRRTDGLLLIVRPLPTDPSGQRTHRRACQTRTPTYELRTFVARFCQIRETLFGQVRDAVNVRNSHNIAYTNLNLWAAHESPGRFFLLSWSTYKPPAEALSLINSRYFKNPPKCQILHCLRNRVHGGASLFVNTFHIARVFHAQDRVLPNLHFSSKGIDLPSNVCAPTERVKGPGLAALTKRYSGADLRRLLLKPGTIEVGLGDFMISIKTGPGGCVFLGVRGRAVAAAAHPLLGDALEHLSALEEAEFEDVGGEGGALERKLTMPPMTSLRVYHPRVVWLAWGRCLSVQRHYTISRDTISSWNADAQGGDRVAVRGGKAARAGGGVHPGAAWVVCGSVGATVHAMLNTLAPARCYC
ncbi:hypothetical protein B0H10DRAFT_1937769 [Mycena sp. CBHHK59/15]|nr:hypothetical protein B0H10DRAFT_1937769 [Mycena sp. CBHHK59/15]